MTEAVAILSLALLCACWVLFQRWIARLDPQTPGIDRSCSGCPNNGACHSAGTCAQERPLEAPRPEPGR
ncbi:MAG: hypothetical protein ACF8R7_02560 [Phycisphaerales bacterium JB039]